jgi:hypothetical protein
VLEELKRHYDLTGRIINESASPTPETDSGILV